jgi:hypothetical protein
VWLDDVVDDFPCAWEPSVVYNAPLGLYVMANWDMSLSPEGKYFARASYVGIWTAPQPRGPWGAGARGERADAGG